MFTVTQMEQLLWFSLKAIHNLINLTEVVASFDVHGGVFSRVVFVGEEDSQIE